MEFVGPGLLLFGVPNQSWFKGNMRTDLARLGSFRFDDPYGEVGIETLLVAKDDGVFQVPLTYRGSHLPGADSHLIGTIEHSLLGTRWIYDAAGDPVYVSALATTILERQPQASQCFEIDGQLHAIPESVQLQSTGIHGCAAPTGPAAVPAIVHGLTTIRTENLELSLTRALKLCEAPSGGCILTATWKGQSAPVQLVSVVRV